MSDWPDSVNEVLAGDQVVGFAYVTPAKGVVLQPLTNIGLLTPVEDRGWVDRHRDRWLRFAGPIPRTRLLKWWLREYHWRVGVQIDVERVVVWPDLGCEGPPTVHGAPLPGGAPSPQKPPAKGTEPRIRHARSARRASKLPHVLLGWVGADGYPTVVPVEVRGVEDRGIRLRAPEGILPEGGRRAGMLAHAFARYAAGQNLVKHTGWLESTADGAAVYAPHTKAGYRMPESKFVFRFASGLVTKQRTRAARRAGFVP